MAASQEAKTMLEETLLRTRSTALGTPKGITMLISDGAARLAAENKDQL